MRACRQSGEMWNHFSSLLNVRSFTHAHAACRLHTWVPRPKALLLAKKFVRVFIAEDWGEDTSSFKVHGKLRILRFFC